MTHPFHREEIDTVWVVDDYNWEHPGSTYDILFADGGRYIAEWCDSFETDNSVEGGEIDIADLRYNEFYMIVFKVLKPDPSDSRLYNEFLCIDYRDFPDRIVDIATGEQVYPAEKVA